MPRNVTLLLVDPQNDFCDLPAQLLPEVCGDRLRPALPVPGAHQDLLRVARFLREAGARIQNITVTLDSHPYLAIERTTFWRDSQGNDVAPFTVITADEVERGAYRPLCRPELVLDQIRRLEAGARHKLVVWPVHCVTGTWGHNIHDQVSQALNEWELLTQGTVQKVLKGEYPWSEHYGVFEADTPLDNVPSTQFNTALAQGLTQGIDLLLVAGEASSHCVAASVDQLMSAIREGRIPQPGKGFEIALMTDCMSPVPGFEQVEQDFIARASSAGVRLTTAREALASLLA